MILDVRAEGGCIVSRATVLDYAEPEPAALPVLQGDALAAYRILQQRVQALKEEVWQRHDSGQQAHELDMRVLQDRLHVLKERIDSSCWHLEERRNRPAKGTARKQFHRDWFVAKRNILHDLIAQNDIAAYFADIPQEGERLIEEEPYYLDTVLQLQYWETQYRALDERGVDHVCMEVVSHRPTDAAAFAKLWAGYAALLRYLDAAAATAQPIRRAGGAAEYRILSGAGLETLLSGERGVHLWFTDQEQAVPFSVHISRLDPAQDLLQQAARIDARNAEDGPGAIIRLYHESSAPRQFVVTDLRSNLIRRSTDPLAATDWKLLLHHGKL
jgi:hypothetical protein